MSVDRTESFRRFISEIRAESDRGLALIGAAFIDERLAATLQAFFVESTGSALLQGGNAPLGAFSARIELCFALGLIEEIERDECNYVRKIRNEFAHKVVSASFNMVKIRDLCSNLKAELPEAGAIMHPRALFENAIITMATRLLYRDIYVSRGRQAAKVWIDPSSIRWRRTAEEPPPKDQTVIGAWCNSGIFDEWQT